MYNTILFFILTGCTISQKSNDIPDQSLFKMADAALLNNDLQNAETLYQKILEKDPKNLEALYKMGILIKRKGNIAQALMIFEACLKEDPNFTKAILEKAYLYVQNKQYEEALNHYHEALKINPQLLAALNGKAMVLDILGKHTEAQYLYQKIIQANPSYSYALNNLGLSYIFQGKWTEAIDILETLNRFSTTPKHRQNLALAYGLKGEEGRCRFLSSQDLSSQAVENNIRFIRNLRKVYHKKGNLDHQNVSLLPALGNTYSAVSKTNLKEDNLKNDNVITHYEVLESADTLYIPSKVVSTSPLQATPTLPPQSVGNLYTSPAIQNTPAPSIPLQNNPLQMNQNPASSSNPFGSSIPLTTSNS
jgi:Flp pilus assembly protein TadD